MLKVRKFHTIRVFFPILGQFFKVSIQCPNELLYNYPFDEYSCYFNVSVAQQFYSLSHSMKVHFIMLAKLEIPKLSGEYDVNFW